MAGKARENRKKGMPETVKQHVGHFKKGNQAALEGNQAARKPARRRKKLEATA